MTAMYSNYNHSNDTDMKRHIPNTITCMNLLSGVVACIMAFHYSDTFGALQGYQWAFICIGAAAVFDFCDGLAARALGAYSDMGKELDSLSDLVSFGVAPAMILFSTICLYAGGDATGISPWAFVALFIPVMGALRLAKFNIDTRQTTSFIGLPIPAAAIFWIGLTAWIHRTGAFNPWVVSVVIVVMSLAMVSDIHMFSLKFKNLSFRDNARRYLLILGAISLVAVEGLSGLAWTIIFYILVSVVTRRFDIGR